MPKQGKKSSVVSGAGLLTEVWTKLDAAVQGLAGENYVNHLHRLTTKEGGDTIYAMAQVIVSDGNKLHRPGRASDRQMKALEEFVARSRDASEYAKKAIIWMLRQTDNLARNISVCFSSSWNEEKTREIGHGVHDMNSMGGSTRIDLMFPLMGIDTGIDSHCGLHSPESGQWDHTLPGYTIWISTRAHYDHCAEKVQPDYQAIEAIDIKEVAENKGFYGKRAMSNR